MTYSLMLAVKIYNEMKEARFARDPPETAYEDRGCDSPGLLMRVQNYYSAVETRIQVDPINDAILDRAVIFLAGH
jgi:hypothetical protein